MTIQYAYLETGDLNHGDVVISDTPPASSVDTMSVQYDDTLESSSLLNAFYKLYTAILDDWGQVENDQIGQILLYSIAADDETSSYDHTRSVGPATINPGQVGVQIDTLNDIQPIQGTLFKILTALFQNPVPPVELWKDDQSVLADGVDEVIAIARPSFHGSDLSIGVWVKTTASSEQFAVGAYNNAGDGWGLGQGGNTFGRYYSQAGANANASERVRGKGWVHLCISVSSGVVTIYHNAGNTGTGGFWSNNSASTWYILSGRATSRTWEGNVDELTIWDKALSSAEVTELYNGGTTFDARDHSASANLKHYYPLDEFFGDNLEWLVEDIVGFNYGTPVNMSNTTNWSTDVP